MINETLFTLVERWAREQPDRAALVDGSNGHVVRYGELPDRIDRLAGALVQLGVTSGVKSVAIMQRSVCLVETVLALSRIGAHCLPLDCAAPRERTLDEARQVLDPGFVFVDDARVGCSAWKRGGETWIDATTLRGASYSRATPDASAEAPLYLNASSGSTGLSKMVVATHGQVIANAVACQRALGFEPGRIHLSTFRIHAHELFARGLVTGGTAVLLPRAEDPVELASALVRFKVNYLMTNPMTLAGLIPIVGPGVLQPYLHLAECGGAPLSRVVKRVIERASGARVISVWGSTETAGVAIAPPLSATHHKEAVGVPIDGYDIVLITPDGGSVAPGVEGEMVVRGAAVAAGYVGPQSGDPRLRDSTFRTGDLARQHADGWLELRGRASSSFKVGGVWVNAERIERVIRDELGVHEVVVVPQRHRTFGYVPIALVVPEHNLTFEPDMTSLAARFEDPLLETPHRFIIVDKVPLTLAGKIDRAACRLDIPHRLPQGRRRFMLFKTLRLATNTLRQPGWWKRILGHPVLYLRLLRLLAKERCIWDVRTQRA